MHSTRRTARNVAACVLGGAMLWVAGHAHAQTLRGSTASLDRQNAQARAHSFSYLRTADQLRQFVADGYLVSVVGNDEFDVHNVSFPYARPEVRLFIHRLAQQYRSACGEKLVVTSLTRPLSNQPSNASSRSVHPTGMAVDLRRPANARCRSWLESTLLGLEANGVLEAIYERNPPHYHVALFPQPYSTYLAQRVGTQTVATLLGDDASAAPVQWVTHRVARGENLTSIARRYDASVSRIRAENGISGSRIIAGQDLRIPVYGPSATGTTVAQASPAESAADEPVRAVADGSGRTAEAGPAASDGADAVPSGGSAGGVVHTVGRGESLWAISRLYGVSEAELRQANGLNGNRILAGQELTVPGASQVASASVVRHRVSRGDSLWSIARRHGVTIDDIRRQNGIGTRIYAGQVLEIPTEG